MEKYLRKVKELECLLGLANIELEAYKEMIIVFGSDYSQEISISIENRRLTKRLKDFNLDKELGWFKLLNRS